MLSLSPRRVSPAPNRIGTSTPQSQPMFSGKHGVSIKRLILPTLLASSGAAALTLPNQSNAVVEKPDTFSLSTRYSADDSLAFLTSCDAFLPEHSDETEGLEKRRASKQSIQDMLKCPPFAPTDVNLFMPQTYNQASAPAPAPAKPVNEGQLIDQLAQLWSKRGNGNPDRAKKEVKALFNNAAFKTAVPDPRLRAAILALKNTPAEDAVRDAAQKRVFSQVIFQDLPAGVIAGVNPNGKNNKPEILVNSRYQHEDFRQIAPALAHESLHQDSIASGREERVNHSLDTLVYAHMIQEDPSLASSNTELAKRQNTKLMARINSRDAKGNLRLFSAKSNVYPGGTPLANFAAAFTATGGGPITDNSPGNSALKLFVKDTTGVNVRQPNFDQALENVMDQNQKALKDQDVIAVAKALKLNTNC